ncbi:unnamed protein product [Spirodela intermedia]|uniref:Uncharacterized protein n=1 Tax=Spirodela intermedia TaxID=51605 RepID=A0A7I8JIE1_SPIIN|nr:unnamed protein product [Spirodela intermedia]CAA6669691.1 unnamed protein product [Spirodela intermedia]
MSIFKSFLSVPRYPFFSVFPQPIQVKNLVTHVVF